jgi:AcrR family transcriptional regulator
MQQARSNTRLSRETWLAEALEVLAKDPAHLRVDQIAQRLGVSKGSFYWHFENREAFVTALAEYWQDADTQIVVRALAQLDSGPEEKLRMMMRLIVDDRLARYDLAVRAWARIEPGIAPIVRKVDETRMATVRDLFAEMGFEEPELSVRTRVFVVAHSFDDALSIPLSDKEVSSQLDTRFEFFTRR